MITATLLTLAAAAQGAPATATPDGRRLRAGSRCWAITRGEQAIGATLQTIRAVRANGAPAWDIVVHQRVGTVFDMRDHFVLRRADLRPIRFDSRAMRGGHPQTVALTYAAGRVIGQKAVDGATTPIDVALAGPTWDGNLWGATFGALQLRAGGNYSLPFYQYDQGLGAFSLTVSGSETVQTPRGPIEAWTVEAGTSPDRRTTYLIAKADGAELGTRNPRGGTRLGGDCTGLD